MLDGINSGAIGVTTIDAPTQHGRGDQHQVKVVRRLKTKHSTSLNLKDWKKKAARLFQFSKTMYGPLKFVVSLYQIHPYAVAAASVLPLIAGMLVGEAVHIVREAYEEAERLRETVNDLTGKIIRLEAKLAAVDQPIEGKVLEGSVVDYTDSGWPKINTGNREEIVPLYGIGKTVNEGIERKWIHDHTNVLSCKLVETSSNGLGPLYRCLAANTFDLAEAMLLNGAAIVSCEAGQSYRDAQDQAKHAKRGMWKHPFFAGNQHCKV